MLHPSHGTAGDRRCRDASPCSPAASTFYTCLAWSTAAGQPGWGLIGGNSVTNQRRQGRAAASAVDCDPLISPTASQSGASQHRGRPRGWDFCERFNPRILCPHSCGNSSPSAVQFKHESAPLELDRCVVERPVAGRLFPDIADRSLPPPRPRPLPALSAAAPRPRRPRRFPLSWFSRWLLTSVGPI